MAKVYVIFHDGTNVAIFGGGTSGDPPTERNGNHLPGGTPEEGESMLEAAKREFEEETGLRPEIITGQHCHKARGLVNTFFFVQWVGKVTDLLAPFHAGPQSASNHG